MRNVRHIFHLGIKEILSLARDPVLLFLIAYCFTFSVYTPAKSAVMDVINASVALVDEDDSPLSRQIRDALLPPLFRPARLIDFVFQICSSAASRAAKTVVAPISSVITLTMVERPPLVCCELLTAPIRICAVAGPNIAVNWVAICWLAAVSPMIFPASVRMRIRRGARENAQ